VHCPVRLPLPLVSNRKARLRISQLRRSASCGLKRGVLKNSFIKFLRRFPFRPPLPLRGWSSHSGKRSPVGINSSAPAGVAIRSHRRQLHGSNEPRCDLRRTGMCQIYARPWLMHCHSHSAIYRSPLVAPRVACRPTSPLRSAPLSSVFFSLPPFQFWPPQTRAFTAHRLPEIATPRLSHLRREANTEAPLAARVRSLHPGEQWRQRRRGRSRGRRRGIASRGQVRAETGRDAVRERGRLGDRGPRAFCAVSRTLFGEAAPGGHTHPGHPVCVWLGG
jgi:hypothetical protein